MGHLSQVAPLPKGFVLKEPHIIGKLLSSPANAVPIELVQRMKTTGIHIQYCKLSISVSHLELVSVTPLLCTMLLMHIFSKSLMLMTHSLSPRWSG